MPPKKRTTGPGRRSKRLRPLPPADLQEAEPATLIQGNPPEAQPVQDTQMMQCNVQALTSAIAAAVFKAVKEAMTSQQQTDHNSTPSGPDSRRGDRVDYARYARREPTTFISGR